MPIPFAKREFVQAPPGSHNAVCVDVIDRGIMPNSYGGDPSPKIELRWQTEQTIPKGPKAGMPYLVTKLYTNSQSEKATIRKDLESWRGRPLTLNDLRTWDFEKLIGVGCTLIIVHKLVNDGTTKARVEIVLPREKKAMKLAPHDYQRVDSRQAVAQEVHHEAASWEEVEEPPLPDESEFPVEPGEEDVPF